MDAEDDEFKTVEVDFMEDEESTDSREVDEWQHWNKLAKLSCIHNLFCIALKGTLQVQQARML